jgi:hypothetical protein
VTVCSDKVELRILGDDERTGATAVDMRAKSLYVVTIDTKLPVRRILEAADIVDTDDEISTAGD